MPIELAPFAYVLRPFLRKLGEREQAGSRILPALGVVGGSCGEAARRLGPRFTLPAFHAAVLDSGSLPMPVLEDKIRAWASAAQAARF